MKAAKLRIIVLQIHVKTKHKTVLLELQNVAFLTPIVLPSRLFVPLKIISLDNHTLPPTLPFGLHATWHSLDCEFTVPHHSTYSPETHLFTYRHLL